MVAPAYQYIYVNLLVREIIVIYIKCLLKIDLFFASFLGRTQAIDEQNSELTYIIMLSYLTIQKRCIMMQMLRRYDLYGHHLFIYTSNSCICGQFCDLCHMHKSQSWPQIAT